MIPGADQKSTLGPALYLGNLHNEGSVAPVVRETEASQVAQ